MIVLDTTVLVYAVGVAHPLREPCRRLVAAAAQLQATTTAEVIQEFTHVYARRRTRAAAAEAARNYIRLLAPLLVVDDVTARLGLDLFERHADIGAFDAVLAAAALGVQASALASADAGFAAVPGLGHVHPGSAEFADLLD